MYNSGSSKVLIEFFKRIKEEIITSIAFVMGVVGFIKLYRGDTGLVTGVLLVLGIGVLWLSAFYLYLKKKDEAGQILGEDIKRPLYSERLRNLALVGIFAVPFLTIMGLAGWKYYESLPSDKIIMLVADFDGPDPQNYRVHQKIIEQLIKATKEYPDVQVKPLGEVITYRQGTSFARAEGKKHKAAIVLWGSYGKTAEMVEITVHFEVLQEPSFLPLHQEEQTLSAAVAKLDRFEIQTQLSREMTYLVLFTIGLVRYEAGDYDTAIDRFTEALKQRTPEQMIEPATIYFYRGTAYSFKDNYSYAMADFAKTIEIKSDYVEAYNNRGVVYAKKGDLDSAIKDYTKALEIKPDFAEAYSNRGVAYYDKGDLDSAIKDHSKALETNPDYAKAYYNRGIAYAIKGDLDSAIKDHSKALETNPDYAKAYNNRGIAYKLKGEKVNAEADFRKVLELSEDPMVRQMATQQLEKLGLK